jgi:hypothetical protein
MSRTYFVGNDEVLVAPGWSISDKINARSTITITIIDKKTAVIETGKSFTIYDGATKFFEGIIIKSASKEKYPGYLEYTLSVSDNTAIADRRIIAKVYENEFAGDIARDLIMEVLGEEGITEGIIDDGPLISKAVFNYIKCSQALDYLKKATGGYIWTIDKDKKLNFYSRLTNESPFVLTDTVQHSNFKLESSMDQYRNTQYVRGGNGKTAIQTEEIPTPKPDGNSRNFIVRFPLSSKPTIEINLNSGGWVAISSDDIGINGLDKNKKWYWSYNSQIITQDNTEVVLSGLDGIRITYQGLRNLFVKVDDPAEISNRGAIEGNTGKYEKLATEKSIDESSQAKEYCSGLLETYGEIKDKVIFSTEIDGLKSGQLLTINKSLYGINDKFLIESISIRPLTPTGFEYTVTALDGASIGGWEEFFKELIRENRDFAIADNEVLITINSFDEQKSIEGTVEIDVFNALYPSDTLFPSDTLYPNDLVVSEVELND